MRPFNSSVVPELFEFAQELAEGVPELGELGLELFEVVLELDQKKLKLCIQRVEDGT